jgi:hypothetical protein
VVDLVATERALVGERMASLKKGGDAGVHKSNSPAGPLVPAITMARAAELAGTSPSQIKRVRKAKPINPALPPATTTRNPWRKNTREIR